MRCTFCQDQYYYGLTCQPIIVRTVHLQTAFEVLEYCGLSCTINNMNQYGAETNGAIIPLSWQSFWAGLVYLLVVCVVQSSFLFFVAEVLKG